VGALVIALGSLALASGKLNYRNWWGGPRLPPFAILGGLIAIVAAVRGKPFEGKSL
jgi:hypothetical protein